MLDTGDIIENSKCLKEKALRKKDVWAWSPQENGLWNNKCLAFQESCESYTRGASTCMLTPCPGSTQVVSNSIVQ